jgi:hypothetical protein
MLPLPMMTSDISYPFWGSNWPAYCGYPKLELNCRNQDLEITIKQLTYKVLHIQKPVTDSQRFPVRLCRKHLPDTPQHHLDSQFFELHI